MTKSAKAGGPNRLHRPSSAHGADERGSLVSGTSYARRVESVFLSPPMTVGRVWRVRQWSFSLRVRVAASRKADAILAVVEELRREGYAFVTMREAAVAFGVS